MQPSKEMQDKWGISKLEVNWMPGYSNSPFIMCHTIKTIKEFGEYTYREVDDCYFGTPNDKSNPFCSFYYYKQPGSGFGGVHIKCPMQDGSIKVLEGPWSSRPGVMNAKGFPQCSDISIREHSTRHHLAGHILLEPLLELINSIPQSDQEFVLCEIIDSGDECTFEPMKIGGVPKRVEQKDTTRPFIWRPMTPKPYDYYYIEGTNDPDNLSMLQKFLLENPNG